jgi:MFS family permease
MRRVLAVRGLPLFFTGQTLSIFGDTAMWLVADVWVKELTGSNGVAGLVYFAFMAGTLFGPVSGIAADRVRRRPLLIWTNVAMSLVVLTLVTVHTRSDIWLVYIVMFCYGVTYSLLDAAQSALLTSMLTDNLLADANGMLQAIRQVLRLLAPLIGAGAFLLVGGGTVAVLDSATFAITALTLVLLKIEEPRPTPSTTHWTRELLTGSRYILGNLRIRQMMLAVGFAMIVFGFFNTVQFAVVAQGLHEPTPYLGVLSSVQGVGAIAAALTAGRVCGKIGEGPIVGIGLAVLAAGSLLLMGTTVWLVFPGVMMVGFSLPWAIVGIVTLLQRNTPREKLGRVYGAFDLFTNAPLTASIAVGSGLIGIVGYRPLLIGMGAGVAVAAVYLLTRAEQWRPLPGPAVAAHSEATH